METLVFLRKYNSKYPNSIGGVITASELLLDYLMKSQKTFEVIDTNKSNYSNKFFATFDIIKLFILKVFKCKNVALNFNENELIVLAPLIVLFCKIIKKPVSLRVFGGNFDEIFQRTILHKCLLTFVLNNSQNIFLETKYLVNKFNLFRNVHHFPNTRSITSNNSRNIEHKNRKKFIFLGHIKKTKGVETILSAFKIDNIGHIDFYGPLVDIDIEQLNTLNSTYKGVAKKEDVQNIMSEYDAFVFPTFYHGEGYPGVILEAYAAGLPVITTQWRAVPELISEGRTGFTVKPNNPNEIVEAILKLDDEFYTAFYKYLPAWLEQFDSEIVHSFYIEKVC
jgi:glycosyltransferase involved in cell wall biosynthesis